MATIGKVGDYDPMNLSATAYHFGKKADDAPVLALLKQGSDPNEIGGMGKLRALHWAATFDRPQVIRALLDAGADPGLSGKTGVTPLMCVKSAEAARLLLESGADVNAATFSNKTGILAGSTALIQVARQGNIEVATTLIAYKADTNLRDEVGCNALMAAALAEKTEMVRFLLNAGAMVGFVEASLLGDCTQVRSFLATEAGFQREEIATALQWAAQAGHTEVAALLLDYGAPIDAGDTSNTTPLMYAAHYGRGAMMSLLLERGADPNVISHSGGTALMASVASGICRKGEAVKLLLDYGAEADIRSRSGWTPLMFSCLWGDTEVVALLLLRGADPNAFTDAEVMEREEGCSTTNALMLAIGNGHIETVKVLLQYGADPLATNNAGFSALSSVQRPRHGYNQAERLQILPLLQAAAGRH